MSPLRTLLLSVACALAVSPLLSSCCSTCKTDTVAKQSLYDRLGGEPAITAVVDDFVGRAAPNPQVNFTRQGSAMPFEASPEKVAHLKQMLVEMIANASGGPQKYTGRSMKNVHAGMGITNAEFDALAGDLKASLDKFKVPAQEQKELFAIVGSTRADIVSGR